MDARGVTEEMEYAAPRLEGMVRRKGADRFATRRRVVAERILARL
jgi:hypothetical protein